MFCSLSIKVTVKPPGGGGGNDIIIIVAAAIGGSVLLTLLCVCILLVWYCIYKKTKRKRRHPRSKYNNYKGTGNFVLPYTVYGEFILLIIIQITQERIVNLMLSVLIDIKYQGTDPSVP